MNIMNIMNDKKYNFQQSTFIMKILQILQIFRFLTVLKLKLSAKRLSKKRLSKKKTFKKKTFKKTDDDSVMIVF